MLFRVKWKLLPSLCSFCFERCPFNWNFRKYRNGNKWYEKFQDKCHKFQGKFPENAEIVEFPKSGTLNQNFREESQMERAFPVRNYRKFRYTLQGFPLFRIFRKCWFIRHQKRPEIQTEILSNGKRPWFSCFQNKQRITKRACDCVIPRGPLQALSLRTEMTFVSCFGGVSQTTEISARAAYCNCIRPKLSEFTAAWNNGGTNTLQFRP